MLMNTFRLILVAQPTSTANVTPVEWVQNDEAVVTLVEDEVQGIKVEEEEETPAERARRLLEELEQEGASLEDSFKDDSSFLPDLDVFPDLVKPGAEAALPMDLEDPEQLLMDLATILPDDNSPPHSPPILTELDELLQMRAQTLLDSDDVDSLLMPPTPSDSGASSPGPNSSPSYAPSTPASIYSDSSNDPEWMPEPQPGPSKSRRKPYSRTKLPVNRAERKKLQNKNAATRYRNKKKVEEEELFQIEADILARNKELLGKVAEVETEMRIVKDLLRNKFRRMGLLN